MRRDELPPGMNPDGSAVPVPALVLQDQGRGALWGLVAGDAVGRRPGSAPTIGAAEQACAIAEVLMGRGHFDVNEVAGRVGRSDSPVASMVRAVPIALFYANDEDLRYSVTIAACESPGEDRTALLAAAAVSGALAAVVFVRGTTASKMLLAALASMDALSVRLVEAAPDTRAAVRAANDALRVDLGLVLEPALALSASSAPGFALRVAMWHLVHETPLTEAIEQTLAVPGMGSAEAAVVGALIGALSGEEAVPDELKEAARALGPPAKPTIERLLPFVDSGPFARG